jgi:5'-nucleotidase (lipoprotein e(P4) family)
MKKLAFILPLLLGCATAPTPPAAAPCNPGLAILNSSLWIQTAAEYDAAAAGAFNGARRAVELGLVQDTNRPAAVIVDVDETVLDNMEFEGRMIRSGRTYDSQEWRTWVNEAKGTAIPGALEFLQWAQRRGVTPFYITNRKADEEAGTVENLRRLGFPMTAETVLVRGERPEWEPRDKAPRRDFVASRYRVLAVLGDDLNDFVNTQGVDAAGRDALVRSHSDRWGTTWFVIPNPVYGSWEDVVAGEGSPCEKLENKVRALR